MNRLVALPWKHPGPSVPFPRPRRLLSVEWRATRSFHQDRGTTHQIPSPPPHSNKGTPLFPFPWENAGSKGRARVLYHSQKISFPEWTGSPNWVAIGAIASCTAAGLLALLFGIDGRESTVQAQEMVLGTEVVPIERLTFEMNEEAETSSHHREFSLWRDGLLPDFHIFLSAILSTIGYSLLGLSVPNVVGKLIDLMRSPGSPGGNLFSSQPTLVCVGLLLGQMVLRYISTTCLSEAALRFSNRLRKALFASLLRKDIAFFDQASTGEVIESMSSNVNEVRLAVRHAVSMGVASFAQIVGGAVSLALISGKLTTIMLLLIPSAVLGGTVYVRFIQRMSKQVQDALNKSTAVAEESISNVRTVRAFASENYEEGRYNSALSNFESKSTGMGHFIAIFQGLSDFYLQGFLICVLLYGRTLVDSGELTGGALGSYMLYTMNLQRAMATISILQGEVVKGMSAGKRILQTINNTPSIPVSGGLQMDTLRGKIEFHNVEFTYPSRPNNKVFHKLNLTLEEGKVYALVGPSGSGKSSIASMIERFYDPQAGEIYIDGVNIKTLDPSWLRNRIGLVSQEPILFSTTIEENIRFGKPDASDEEIREAARLANAESFINSFPNGYATTVGERGVQMSGGQKQRIAIARAILKNAPILILDEATSALDSESEHLVQEALQRLMKGRTTLLIAHRLSTVKNADVIVVLKTGTIVEMGSHAELIQKQGVYSQLVSKQKIIH